MPDLLLELFSEEIPARMQRQAADDLRRLFTSALVDAGLPYEGAQSFATPRRLTLHVVGLPAAQPKTIEERKGPRVGAPDAAVQGFLKSAGLASLAEARIQKDPKKGEFYVAAIERSGRAAIEVIADIAPAIIRNFPWPKSMRWGAASGRSDALRWVRPLHAIVCTLAAPNETVEVVRFAVDGIEAGDTTFGHRFMAPQPICVRRYDDYVDALFKAKVVLDAERRRQIILADARSLALAHGLEIVDDEALLEEVGGLVEWPVVLLGEFEPAFLELPPEVIRATIRANQKCFVTRSAGFGDESRAVMASGGAQENAPARSRLANRFIIVANLVARDGGAAIAAGNARVVRARLADARHFWRTDLAPLPGYQDKADKPLDQRLAKLRALNIVFHEKLGAQGERVDRIVALARELAPLVGADPALAARAAELAKADLVTEMVGEFPELQGLMGRYYAAAQGEAPEVAAAIEEHYKPQGPNDCIPDAPVSIAVALADKLDTLVGFWAIHEKPTGSKDPYALRRAALGVIRILVENSLRLELNSILNDAFDLVPGGSSAGETRPLNDLVQFFADRLKVYLRDRGNRHDLIEAVFATPVRGDLWMAVRRVEALGSALESEDVKNLLAGYKRAANILRAEESKEQAGTLKQPYDPLKLILPQEKQLAAANSAAFAVVSALMSNEDFAAAMRELAKLRGPIDDFFTHVTVNTDDDALRLNRLRLLNGLREAVHAVADFSKIAG